MTRTRVNKWNESVLYSKMSVPTEIHLRRMMVLEALQKLEKYLNDAAIGRLPRVRIIHGKGTGKLKRAVLDYLSNHPDVSKYYPALPSEGNGGVTIAELEEINHT
jgi:DNA mismatch repair protein MutS2